MTQERRINTRYDVHLPVVVVPVNAGGMPDVTRKVSGQLKDISLSGMRLSIHELNDLAYTSLAVIIENEQGHSSFAGVKVVHSLVNSPNSQGDQLMIGGTFAGRVDQLFRTGQILPQPQPQTGSFEYIFPQDSLQAWCEADFLESVLLDRLLACPQCCGGCTFRFGCRRCLSGRTEKVRHIHHYACANIAPINEYEVNGTSDLSQVSKPPPQYRSGLRIPTHAPMLGL